MSLPLIVRPLAEADLAESYAWYEEQRTGLGREFLDEVDAAFAKIAEAPLRYARIHKETRRALTKRFPFAVFYVAEPAPPRASTCDTCRWLQNCDTSCATGSSVAKGPTS